VKKIYTSAKKFLIERIPSKDARAILNSYLELPAQNHESVAIPELFRRLLSSAQNSNMKASVIGKSIGGFDNLGKALYSFDPRRTVKTFDGAPDALLDHIVNVLHPHGKIRTEPKSIWPKYCKTILSSAAFFNQFSSGDEFVEWANSLYGNRRSMPALPMILAAEIEGIGYPLACDFLKEFGFVQYGKPDVHVIEIFVGIGLCRPKPSPYQVQKVITQIAEAAGVSSYDVDKLFWLIGSGKFYKNEHKHLGKDGHIGRMKQEFISQFKP
jgi:hypothetical protein